MRGWKIQKTSICTEQEFMTKKNIIAIIGGGPAGIMCAIEAAKNQANHIIIIEQNKILQTLLPTGGGRCNLAHNEFDIKELAKNYPRGEKFLYSVFSQFSTEKTLEFFKDIGVPTITEKDNRIFPVSNSSAQVQSALLAQIDLPNIEIVKKRVYNVNFVNNKYEIELSTNVLKADILVLACGGKASGFKFAKNLGHTIETPRPALTALKIKETQFYELPGISLENIKTDVIFENRAVCKIKGDLLFTHKSISGPLILKISSICAFMDYNLTNPLQIKVNIVGEEQNKFRNKLNKEISKNPKKNLLNVISKFCSRYLASTLLDSIKIDSEINCAEISNAQISKIAEIFTNYTFHAVAPIEEIAMVTAGGVKLNEIDPKSMQSKKCPKLFFCGEILNIDGLTGGFNLQNCWSTGFISGNYLGKNTK